MLLEGNINRLMECLWLVNQNKRIEAKASANR